MYDEKYYDVFHVDDLLVNFNDPEDYRLFPRLERLELFECTCRLNGLLTFIKQHRRTLKQLILNRITLHPYQSPALWNEIAAFCKEAVPGLAYASFHKTGNMPSKPFQ